MISYPTTPHVRAVDAEVVTAAAVVVVVVTGSWVAEVVVVVVVTGSWAAEVVVVVVVTGTWAEVVVVVVTGTWAEVVVVVVVAGFDVVVVVAGFDVVVVVVGFDVVVVVLVVVLVVVVVFLVVVVVVVFLVVVVVLVALGGFRILTMEFKILRGFLGCCGGSRRGCSPHLERVSLLQVEGGELGVSPLRDCEISLAQLGGGSKSTWQGHDGKQSEWIELHSEDRTQLNECV